MRRTVRRIASDLRSAEAATRDLISDLQGESWRGGGPDGRIAVLERAAQRLGAAAQGLVRARDADNAQIAVDSVLGVLRIAVVVVVLVAVSVSPFHFALAVVSSALVLTCVERAGLPVLLRGRLRRRWNAGSASRRIRYLSTMIDAVRRRAAADTDSRVFKSIDEHTAVAGAALLSLDSTTRPPSTAG